MSWWTDITPWFRDHGKSEAQKRREAERAARILAKKKRLAARAAYLAAIAAAKRQAAAIAAAKRKKQINAVAALAKKAQAFQNKYHIAGKNTKPQVSAFFAVVDLYIKDKIKHKAITNAEKQGFVEKIIAYGLNVVINQPKTKIYTFTDITNIWKKLLPKYNEFTYFTTKDYKKQFRFYRNKPARVEMRTSTDKGKTWTNWKNIAGTHTRPITKATQTDTFGNAILDAIDGAFVAHIPLLGSKISGGGFGYLSRGLLASYTLVAGASSRRFNGVNTFGFSQDIYKNELLIGSETGNYAELQEL